MRAVIRFADQSVCNISADRMVISEDGIYLLAYRAGDMVGLFELSSVLSAHLSEERRNGQ